VVLAAPASAAFRLAHHQLFAAGAALLVIPVLWVAAARALPRSLVALLLATTLDVVLLLRSYARLPDADSPWLRAGLCIPIVYLVGLGFLLGSVGHQPAPRAHRPPGA